MPLEDSIAQLRSRGVWSVILLWKKMHNFVIFYKVTHETIVFLCNYNKRHFEKWVMVFLIKFQ